MDTITLSQITNAQIDAIGETYQLTSKIISDKQICCIKGDYSDVAVIHRNGTFLNPKEYLPFLHDMTEWYCSSTCLLLKRSGSKLRVMQGFLARWKDEQNMFWYEDDVIENVIGWLPQPELLKNIPSAIPCSNLKKNTTDRSYWTIGLDAVGELPNQYGLMDAKKTIPPLLKESKQHLESIPCVVQYEYSTANGMQTDCAISSYSYKKESKQGDWDLSNFDYLHHSLCEVTAWMPLPKHKA